jgi:hypothetical protein
MAAASSRIVIVCLISIINFADKGTNKYANKQIMGIQNGNAVGLSPQSLLTARQ